MFILTKHMKILKKDPKQICIRLGAIYSGFGAFSYFILTMQKSMLSNFNTETSDEFAKLMTTLHEIWGIYMPLLFLLGLGYMAFGLFFNKISINKFKINQVISLISLLLVIGYTISSFEFFKIFSTNAQQDFEFFKYISYVFAGFGFFAIFVLMTVPQYIIGKKIKQLEIENNSNAI